MCENTKERIREHNLIPIIYDDPLIKQKYFL